MRGTCLVLWKSLVGGERKTTVELYWCCYLATSL